MKDLNPEGLRKFSQHILACSTHSSELPKDLLELQGYLKQLSRYVERYHQIRDNVAQQKGSAKLECGKTREVSFSVREEVENAQAVEIIEEVPAEVVTVITTKEATRKAGDGDEEGDFASASSQLEADEGSRKEGEEDDADGGVVSGDDSEIGIYFIDDVNPRHFIDIVQRELCTLATLFPGASCIVKEIAKEFEHFKVCCGCQKKISPILPDILKEIQELIKFIKKKRNEKYTWPDDSDYLRKQPEGPPKPFKKEDKDSDKKTVRKETVGYVTIQTNTPTLLKEAEASIRGEHSTHGQSEYAKVYSVRVTNCPQLSLFQSKILSEVTRIEKLETLDLGPKPNGENGVRECSFLTESSSVRLLLTLHPEPVVETALQYRVVGYARAYGGVIGEEEPERVFVNLLPGSNDEVSLVDESVDPLVLEAREFLLTARVALGEACLELQLESENKEKMKCDRKLKTDLRNLKDLMLEVHKNQIELSKVLLEKGVLNPAMVQLTDPQMLQEEREGIQKARNSLTETGPALDGLTGENLQQLVRDLNVRCKAKNQMITTLLRGLRSNIPRQHWEKLMSFMLQESDSGQEVKADVFLRRSSFALSEAEKVLGKYLEAKPCPGEELGIEELLSERELSRTTYDDGPRPKRSATFSEVTPKTPKCLHTMESGFRLPNGMTASKTKGLNMESDNPADLDNSINSGRSYEVDGLQGDASTTQDQGTATDDAPDGDGTVEPRETGSTTINLTIKIGESDSRSQYHSALSILPSGATLKEKKSETSLPVSGTSVQEFASALNFPPPSERPRPPANRKRGSFTSLALKLKLPLPVDEDDRKRKIPGEVIPASEDRRLQSDCLTALQVQSNDGNLSDLTNDEPGKSELECDSDSSNLYPQMSIHYEQNQTIQNLRDRLRCLEQDIRGLRMTIDRMSILTEKFVDDAADSSQNFSDVRRRFRFISGLLSK